VWGGCCPGMNDSLLSNSQSEHISVDFSSNINYTCVLLGDTMSDKSFNGDQKIKLTQIINEGMQVMHEIDTLQGGLNDTVKAVAEELEIKPAVLKKAIKIAHKAEFGKAKQDHELLETILETVGKTL
jgi:hypothetical protein